MLLILAHLFQLRNFYTELPIPSPSTRVAHWQEKLAELPEDALIRRGLVYSLLMAVPDRDGICLLTDHMLLPLSWNRDAYYTARALLAWDANRDQCREVVRRHIHWMFELTARREGFWGRCYLANGLIKDAAFQLDQQLYPNP